jgi:hypothetical protein
MKSTFKSLKFGNLRFAEDNYRSKYEFPSEAELTELGKSIEENGLLLLDELDVEPALDDKGNRIPDSYTTISGNVRLAAIGTLPVQKRNEILIPCKVWSGLTPDERTKIMFLRNEQTKPISLWSQATVLERYKKNGYKDKQAALSMNKTPQVVSILSTLLAYPVDIREEGQKGRFSPTLAWQLLSAKGAKKNPEPVFAKVREVLAKVPDTEKVTAKDFEIEETAETIEVSKESFDAIKANAEKSVLLEAELARVKAESSYASQYKELESLVSKLPATETAELKAILIKAANDTGARTTEAYVAATTPITEGIEIAKLLVADRAKGIEALANVDLLNKQNSAQDAGKQALANLPTGEPTGDTAGHIKAVTEQVGDNKPIDPTTVQTPSAPVAPVNAPVNAPATLPPTEAPDKHQSEIERIKAHIGVSLNKMRDTISGSKLSGNNSSIPAEARIKLLLGSLTTLDNTIARLMREEGLIP